LAVGIASPSGFQFQDAYELRSARRGSSSSDRRDVNIRNRLGANRIAGSRTISASFRWRSLLAGHAQRDTDALRLLARSALCSLKSLRNLCGGFLASHTLEKADVIFRPNSPTRLLLRPCNGFSHVSSCLVRLWNEPRFAQTIIACNFCKPLRTSCNQFRMTLG